MGNVASCVSLSKGPVCKHCGERGETPWWAMDAAQRGRWVMSKEGICCKTCLVGKYQAELERSSSLEPSPQQTLPAPSPLWKLHRASAPHASHRIYRSSSSGSSSGGGCGELALPGQGPRLPGLSRQSMPVAGPTSAGGSGHGGRQFGPGVANGRRSMSMPLSSYGSPAGPAPGVRGGQSPSPAPLLTLQRHSTSPAELPRLMSGAGAGAGAGVGAPPQLGRHSSGTLLSAYASSGGQAAAGGGSPQPKPLSRLSQGRGSAHSLVGGGGGEQPRGGSPPRSGSSKGYSWGEEGQLDSWLDGYSRKASLSTGGPRRRSGGA